MTSAVCFSFQRVVWSPDGGLPGIPGAGSFGAQRSNGPRLPGIPGIPGIPGGSVADGPRPPATPSTYELSGWGRRALATILDGFVISLIAIPLFVLLATIISGTTAPNTSSSDEFEEFLLYMMVLLATFTVIALFYAPVFMARMRGATPGKRALGIRVVRANGAAVDFKYAAIREIAVKAILIGGLSSSFGGVPALVNYLWPLIDAEHRALHDMIVKSRVVRDA